MLDRSQQPVSVVQQVRRLPVEVERVLEPAGGEVEAQQRLVTDGRPRVGKGEPERVRTCRHRTRMTGQTQSLCDSRGRRPLARVARHEDDTPGNRGGDRDKDHGEPEAAAGHRAIIRPTAPGFHRMGEIPGKTLNRGRSAVRRFGS